jgi:aspartate/glutamate racemase
MNKMLERAFAEAARLPDAEQQTIASLIFEEVANEREWTKRFATTQDQLGELVRRARDEVARGDVFPYDPSNRPAK